MKRLRIWLLGAIPVLIVVWIATRPDRYHTASRIKWKDTALAELRAELSNELALNATRDRKLYDDNLWIDDSLIHFRNGEWILFRSICHKENSAVHDIFLGRGSDGNWYYSTFHFCIGLSVLQMQGPSESLIDFKTNYCLASFDGTSDICLNETWPRQH